jgi:plasmid stabilization system protein ParE
VSRYVVRPKADQDLDDQAYYYATEAIPEVGHRFLVAAHDTFALLARQPEMGWRVRIKHPGLESLRVFRVSGFSSSTALILKEWMF